ncbi:MAG: tRNA (adenosine(37)-N6)-threonylcarbamoyltransferase complex ATPase subunit type 1 TsaE [Desulfovibrionaceae bacterium]|nr:tRNA (adenosine(37)-N6)-threonylcarbamoyltransferase complex ATPase subunit type 1 TsaE [Desulfovibrionaceae bacterium]
MTIRLPDIESTLELGRCLARAMGREAPFPALLLKGQLGAGKTTLVRGLVGNLPGADRAEVSSPSFNILNLYPTTPEVAHFDLYRQKDLPADDLLLEYLAEQRLLVVLEWIEYLDKRHWPADRLILEWRPLDPGRAAGRIVEIRAQGLISTAVLTNLRERLKAFEIMQGDSHR